MKQVNRGSNTHRIKRSAADGKDTKLPSLLGSSLWIRSLDGEDSFSISVLDKELKSRLTLNPKQNGLLMQTLGRLAKKVDLSESAVLSLVGDQLSEDRLDCDILNSLAWITSKFLKIRDGENEYCFPIRYNPPCVTEITIGRRIVVGCRLVARVALEFGLLEHARMLWKRCRLDDPSCDVVVGDGPEYIPQAADVGHSIVCEVVPFDKHGEPGFGGATGSQGSFKRRPLGESDGAGRSSKGAAQADAAADAGAGPVVEEFPADWPFAARRRSAWGAGLRACSYNVLCDQFCDTEWARANLYGGCAREWLSVHYRVRLVLRELEEAAPDIVCLQEVEAATVTAYLEPVLARLGYTCWYSPKPGASGWGLCMAWRADRLRAAEQRRVELSDPAEWGRVPGAADLCGRWPALREAMAECGTIAQLALLQCVGDAAGEGGPAGARTLCVCNTHLFGNPDGPHVRLLQTAIILRHGARRAPWVARGLLASGAAGRHPAASPHAPQP